eukprot:231508-Pleurochrysis_carterae.AAC.1
MYFCVCLPLRCRSQHRASRPRRRQASRYTGTTNRHELRTGYSRATYWARQVGEAKTVMVSLVLQTARSNLDALLPKFRLGIIAHELLTEG